MKDIIEIWRLNDMQWDVTRFQEFDEVQRVNDVTQQDLKKQANQIEREAQCHPTATT